MSLVPTRDEAPQIMRYRGANNHPVAFQGTGRSSGAFGFDDLLSFLRRRIWLILLFVAIFAALSMVATFIWLKTAPIYSSFGLLAVNPPKMTELTANRSGPLGGETMDRLMRSQVRSVLTEKVLRQALEDPNVQATHWYEQHSSGNQDVVEELSESLTVAVEPKTNFIRIAMTGFNPEEISIIANKVIQAAYDESKRSQTDDLSDGINRMLRERDQLNTEIAKTHELIVGLLARGGGAAEPSLETLTSTAHAVTVHLVEAKKVFLEASKANQSMNNMTDAQLAETPEVQQILQMDPIIRGLETQVLNLEMEMDVARARHGEQHRTTQALVQRLAVARLKLQKEQEELISKTVAMLREARKLEAEIAGANYESLKTQEEELDTKIKLNQSRAAQLKAHQEKKAKLERRLEVLDTRILDLRLLMRGEQPVSIHRPALTPKRPSSPRWIIMVPLGVFLGLFFGVGLSVLLEMMDKSIKAPADVSRRVDLPLLGMVPHLDELEEDVSDLYHAFMEHPDSLLGESFRTIRTQLTFSGPAEHRRSMIVTSPMPEDGRTSVAINLAHALARDGKRVLLIDANFRQPIFSKLFPQCPSGGLSSVLTGQSKWRDQITMVDPNMFMMASGETPSSPSELLGSPEMREMIEDLCQEYDRVIFDTPPCLVVSDAAILSTLTDGTILVIRSGVNTYTIVQRARDLLARLGSHIFGVVLNGVKVSAGGYIRKSYETYYDYQYRETPQLPSIKSQKSSKKQSASRKESETQNPDEDLASAMASAAATATVTEPGVEFEEPEAAGVDLEETADDPFPVQDILGQEEDEGIEFPSDEEPKRSNDDEDGDIDILG